MIYTLTLNPAIDYVMHPLTLDMGFTNRSSVEEFHCGGNGINIACVLNELGVPNVAMGFIAGFTGDYILDTLQDEGVTCNFVKLDKGNTRINIKLNGIVMTIVNGVGPKVPQSKLNELFERVDSIQEGDTLVLTGSIPSTIPDTIYDIMMRRLEGRGIRFVVDAPGQELIKALPRKPFFIKPNNHEVGRLFNVQPETPEEVLPYARLLHDQGAQNVVVSCGSYGSALIDEFGEEHIVPTPECRLVNATGAGDSMVAGFLAKYDETGDYETALRFASCCGSATAASKGLANKVTIERFFDSLNEQIDGPKKKSSETAKPAKSSKKSANSKVEKTSKSAKSSTKAKSSTGSKKTSGKQTRSSNSGSSVKKATKAKTGSK